MKKIALIQPETIRSWETGEIERIRHWVNADPRKRQFVLVDNPHEADLIVLLESCTVKNHENIAEYENWIDYGYRDGKKLLVINYEDTPSGVLPGVYSSLERTNYEDVLHRSWPHLRLPNEHIDTQIDLPNQENTYLFSFAGSCSHVVRKRIFDAYPTPNPRYSVREIKKWYNHEPEEKISYVQEILRSRFVLCPHGIASYTHRIIETLALGRVPVIIADNWIPFSINQDNYYILIKESDVDKIDEILQFQLPSYEIFRQNARLVYNTYFSPEIRYTMVLNGLVDLSEKLPPGLDATALKERMHKTAFWKMNGWLLRQRIWNRATWEITNNLRRIKRRSRAWLSHCKLKFKILKVKERGLENK